MAALRDRLERLRTTVQTRYLFLHRHITRDVALKRRQIEQ